MSKVMLPIDTSWAISYSTFNDPITESPVLKYLTCNFDYLEPAVQGLPRSKIMVLIDSSLVVSHMTSMNCDIVSLMVFEIFHTEILSPISRTVQGRPRSKVMVPIDSPEVF